MINFSEIETTLKNLILEKKHKQYIKLFHATFQRASTTEDINNLLVLLFQIELVHKIYKTSSIFHQYKSFLIFIKKIICELLSQGIIPHREYLHLYNIFSNFDFDEDINITNLLNYFKEDIKAIPWNKEDKFTENNIILLLEILNGNKQEALVQYTKNIVLTDIHLAQQGLHCQFIGMFSSSTENFTIDIILEAISFYLDTEIYFSLTLTEKKSLYAWGYELLLNASKFTKSLQTKKLYPKLKNIIDIHIQNNEIEELMYAEFFTMISQMTVYQKPEESEKFNTEITYPCSKVYEKYSIENNLIQPTVYNNAKKKIAILFERLTEHSPFKVVFSLLEQIQKDKNFTDNYEIEIYVLNYYLPLFNVKETEKKLADIGVNVIYPVDTYLELDNYSSRIERALKIRNTIIENQVDIMIACFNSYDILNFLFVSRTAPKQIFWSHNDGHYDVPGIDKRISHFTQVKNNFDFDVFSMPIDFVKYNPEVAQNIIKEIKDSYPKDSFILGCIGRLIKIDDYEYLETIAKIMKQNPNTIYLACGAGDNSNIKKIIKELNIADRFYFTGHVDPHIYGHVIDLYLTSFHSGGAALYEYVFKEKPFIVKHIYYEDNIKRCNTYNLLEKLKKQDQESVYCELYNKTNLLSLKENNYLYKENKAASMFACIPSVKDNNEFIDVANLLITSQEIRSKVAKETVLMAQLDNQNAQSSFIDIICKNK